MTGAGGFASVTRAEAPGDTTAAAIADSAAIRPDNAGARGDSVAVPPYTPAYTPAPAAQGVVEPARALPSRGDTVGHDRDRFEFGAGLVQGYFSTVGTLGYRRFAAERRGWQQWVMGELTGTRRSDLTEGTASFYYLFRHRRTYRASARVRPLL